MQAETVDVLNSVSSTIWDFVAQRCAIKHNMIFFMFFILIRSSIWSPSPLFTSFVKSVFKDIINSNKLNVNGLLAFSTKDTTK